jgi:hypothetical protein
MRRRRVFIPSGHRFRLLPRVFFLTVSILLNLFSKGVLLHERPNILIISVLLSFVDLLSPLRGMSISIVFPSHEVLLECLCGKMPFLSPAILSIILRYIGI